MVWAGKRTRSALKLMVWATYCINQGVRRRFGKLMACPFDRVWVLRVFEQLLMQKSRDFACPTHIHMIIMRSDYQKKTKLYMMSSLYSEPQTGGQIHWRHERPPKILEGTKNYLEGTKTLLITSKHSCDIRRVLRDVFNGYSVPFRPKTFKWCSVIIWEQQIKTKLSNFEELI